MNGTHPDDGKMDGKDYNTMPEAKRADAERMAKLDAQKDAQGQNAEHPLEKLGRVFKGERP